MTKKRQTKKRTTSSRKSTKKHSTSKKSTKKSKKVSNKAVKKLTDKEIPIKDDKDHEIKYLRTYIEQLESQNKKIEVEFHKQLENAQAHMKTLSGDLFGNRHILDENKFLQKRVEELKEENAERQVDILELKDKITKHAQKANTDVQNISKILNSKNLLEEENTKLKNLLFEARQETQEISLELSSVKNKSRAHNKDVVEKSVYDSHINDYEGEIRKLRKDVLESKKKIDILNDQLHTEKIAKEKALTELAADVQSRHTENTGLSSKLKELRGTITRLENENESMAKEFERQLKHKDKHLEKLSSVASKTENVEEESENLSTQISNLEKENELLKQNISDMIKQYSSEKSSLTEKVAVYDDQVSRLKKELSERLRRSHSQDQQVTLERQEMQKQLLEFKKQASDSRHDMLRLRELAMEKDSIIEELKNNFDKQIESREAEILRLSSEKQEDKPKSIDEGHLSRLVKIKEETNQRLVSELTAIRASERSAMKKFETFQNKYKDMEGFYKKLLKESRDAYDDRIKELVTEYSDREIAAHSELERMKSRLKEQEAILRSKQDQIQDTIEAFQQISQQLLEHGQMPNTNITEFVKDKKAQESIKVEQDRLNMLMKEAEQKIDFVKQREDALARREDMLTKEHAALLKELRTIKMPKSEMYQEKEIKMPDNEDKLSKLLEEIHLAPSPKEQQEQIQELPKPKIDDIPKKDLPIPKFDESKPEKVPVDNSMFEKQEIGHSIEHEIMSIADIAIEHGESIEKIKHSLISSGYDEDAVNNVLNNIKKN